MHWALGAGPMWILWIGSLLLTLYVLGPCSWAWADTLDLGPCFMLWAPVAGPVRTLLNWVPASAVDPLCHRPLLLGLYRCFGMGSGSLL